MAGSEGPPQPGNGSDERAAGGNRFGSMRGSEADIAALKAMAEGPEPEGSEPDSAVESEEPQVQGVDASPAEPESLSSPEAAEADRKLDELLEPLRQNKHNHDAIIAYLAQAPALLDQMGDTPEERHKHAERLEYYQKLREAVFEGRVGRPAGDAEPTAPEPEPLDVPNTEAVPEHLSAALQKLAEERSEQRGRSSGLRWRNHHKSAEEESRLNAVDDQYLEAVLTESTAIIERMQAEGGSQAEIADQLARLVMEQQIMRSGRELAFQQERRGDRFENFANRLRHNIKFRLAVNVGLAAVAIGAAASGVGAVAVGAGVARIGWRGVAGYFAGEAGYDAVRAARQKRAGKKLAGELGDMDSADVTQLRSSPHRSKELGIDNDSITGEVNQGRAETVLEAYRAQARELRESVAKLLSDESGEDSLKAVLDQIFKTQQAQLDQEREQLGQDRKITRNRRAVGLLAGAVLSAGLPGLAVHEVTQHLHGGGGGHETATSHLNNWDKVEVHDIHSPEAYGSHGVAIDHVNAGETPQQFALKHLSKFKGWHSFSPQEQMSKVNHFANQLSQQDFKDGARIRWNFDMAIGSFNFKG